MIDLAIYAASWLMMFFSIFVILQTVGVNLAPGWAGSRIFLIFAVAATVVGSNVVLTTL